MPSLPRRLHRSLFLAALGLSPLVAPAVTPLNRIASIDGASRATIAHAVAGRTKASTDLGQAPADRRLEGVTLFFSRTAAQQAALDQLLVEQQTPGSPRFRHWLTPAQFGAQFGLSAVDLQKVTSWLTGQGLTVAYVAPSNTLVRVSGTVAQLQQAFGTSIHSVKSQGEQHIANVTDPVLPAAIAGVVSGIYGLNDFAPHSNARSRTVAPSFTSGVSGDRFLSPGDFQVIYNSKPLLASAINGTGASIAVVGRANLSLPEVAAFRTAAGLPAQVPTVIQASTAAPNGDGFDLEESQLDVEWAAASAPNAQIIYVTSDDVFGSLQYAITQRVAPILSISYGSCEPSNSASDLTSFSALFQVANAQGQTILSASGDSGATDCDFNTVAAADGLAVTFPASSPFVTAVGGTMFNDTDANWATSTSADQITSALGYIPETVWNEYSSIKSLAASGGGASLYFAKPAWQVAAGVPADSSRDVPDVALNAAANHVGYLYCIPVVAGDASATVPSCTNGFRNSAGTLSVVGGTSAGTPSFAGVLALIEQKLNATAGLGNINPTLYGQAGTAAFHDITTGNNSSPCTAGSPDCQSASSIGFSAAPGYDQATGLGSIDANVMANTWASTPAAGGTSTTGTAASYVTVTVPAGTQSCAVSSGSLTVSVQVAASAPVGTAPTGAVPTGAVQLLVDGGAVGTPVTLSGGLATLVVNTASLSSGGHSIAALYTGSSVYAASKSYLGAGLLPTVSNYGAAAPNTIIDVVSASSPDFALTPCLPAINVASGATSAPFTLSASSLNGFSGAVTFTVSTDSALAASYHFSGVSPVTVSAATAGTTDLTISAFTTSTTSTTSNAVHGSAIKRIPSSGTASLHRQHELLGAGAGTAALASVLFLVLPRRRRYVGLLVVILSAGAMCISGCGSGATPIDGGTGTGTTTTPTSPGVYVVNVTASGSNSAGQALVHTTYVTLTVTQ